MKLRDGGLVLMKEHPLFYASSDAIGTDFIVDVKCPQSKPSETRYIKEDSTVAEKFEAQVQLQMLAKECKMYNVYGYILTKVMFKTQM